VGSVTPFEGESQVLRDLLGLPSEGSIVGRASSASVIPRSAASMISAALRLYSSRFCSMTTSNSSWLPPAIRAKASKELISVS
jgi:hypothetical protein